MLSIGELAHRTGVSRRMLRHWEDVGLLVPAEVDTWTGHRRYEPHQAGRVRAIASLRAVGFKLDTIRDLLSSGLSQDRLVDLLRSRIAELEAQISDASTCLQEVHSRLTSLTDGHKIIMNSLELGTLPVLHLEGKQATVSDESEIGDAARDLLSDLRRHFLGDQQEFVLAYDGTLDEDSITVTAGITAAETQQPRAGLQVITITGSSRGATVRYDVSPADIGDAWVTLDGALENYSLTTAGIYRQTLQPNGGVILQAPIAGLHE